MDFSKKLNEYIDLLDCSGKELSIHSNIKQPIISSYRNNTRIPKYNSNNYNNLIKGLVIISKNKNINLSEDDINNTFKSCYNIDKIDYELFKNNLNTLKINVSNLSKYIGFDSSFISKIKSGIRKPSNINEFTSKVAKFVINNYPENIIKELIKNDVNHNNIYTWLINNNKIIEEYNINNFIKKLDDFDLNNYIKAIKFDKLFTPTLPKIITRSKIYYGFDGFKEAQVEVLKQCAFHKNKNEIFMFSNMPMIEARFKIYEKIYDVFSFYLKKRH